MAASIELLHPNHNPNLSIAQDDAHVLIAYSLGSNATRRNSLERTQAYTDQIGCDVAMIGSIDQEGTRFHVDLGAPNPHRPTKRLGTEFIDACKYRTEAVRNLSPRYEKIVLTGHSLGARRLLELCTSQRPTL